MSYASSDDALSDGLGVTVNLLTGETSGDDAEGDTLVGIENLIGSAFQDTLTGNLGANTLQGGDGDDILYGSNGNDILEGGDGDDILYGGKHLDFLEGGDGDDILYGERGADTLYGNRGGDTLYGGGGADTLSGGDGEDTLYGGKHGDFLEGGGGTDTYVFESGDDADTIRGDTDGGRLYFKNAASFSDFVFSRNDADDVVIAVGEDSVTIEDFAQGRYSIHYGSENTALGRLSLAATAGGELTATDDEGADLMLGSSANDTLDGLGGDDTLYGYAGIDRLYGGEGDDTLYGGDASDTLKGGAGNDLLYGGEGADLLRGGADADTLHGGGGGDTIDGGEGVDIASYTTSYTGVRVSLVLQEEHQIDFEGQYGIEANQNHAVGDILSNIENIYGSDYIDWLTGDDNVNEIYGGAGNDRLEGGAGDDILHGGRGDDTLHGGAGTDTYVFSVGDEADAIVDNAGDAMTLRFEGSAYTLEDFNSGNINRVGNNLEITIDKNRHDGITERLKVYGAYDTDPATGTGNAAYTINIEYGSDGTFTEVTNDFWHTLT